MSRLAEISPQSGLLRSNPSFPAGTTTDLLGTPRFSKCLPRLDTFWMSTLSASLEERRSFCYQARGSHLTLGPGSLGSAALRLLAAFLTALTLFALGLGGIRLGPKKCV